MCTVNQQKIEENAKLKATLPDTNPLKQIASSQEAFSLAMSVAGDCDLAWVALGSSTKTLKDAQELQKAVDYAKNLKPTAAAKPESK